MQVPQHYPRVNLDAFVVMPNHIHGVIQIVHESRWIQPPPSASAPNKSPHVDKGSVGAVIRSFKSIVTKRARNEYGFQGEIWQRNYYERLLRNEREFLGASQYILDNPRRWDLDEEYPGRERKR